jgi:ADP-glucose pyrophosphorylase
LRINLYNGRRPHTDTLALILGGGAGNRLYPLTKQRAKPAVPIAGSYRLVDIPISNCLNSGIQKIYILTQYNSVSLHRHITQTYQFGLFSSGWVQILAAEQTASSVDWYQGTADALRKQRTELETVDPQDFLILSGDHLYRMDYEAFLRAHRSADADVTVDGDCRLNRALLAPGARVVGSDIHHSIVGVRSQIGPACRLSHTIMMGADFFESDADKAANAAAGRPNVGIGANCVIDGAIIDKNARIGSDTVIRPLAGRPDFDADNYAVRDGIVVVMKNAAIGRARSFRPPTNLLRARRWVENPDAPAPGSAGLPAPATKNPRPACDSNSSAL